MYNRIIYYSYVERSNLMSVLILIRCFGYGKGNVETSVKLILVLSAHPGVTTSLC